MMNLHSLVLLAGLCSSMGSHAAQTPRPPILVLFSSSRVTISGTYDHQDSVDQIVAAIRQARPDLRIRIDQVNLNSDTKLPDLGALKTLIVEIALSTSEGELEIDEEEVTVGGLTESVVTFAVLKLRAAAILESRTYREQLCLVPATDFPDAPIRLSNGESRVIASEHLPIIVNSNYQFELPGIPLDKLRKLIDNTADLDWLETGVSALDKKTLPIESPAIQVADDSNSVEVVVLPPPLPDLVEADIHVDATPASTDLGPILFTPNTALLRGGEQDKLSAVVESLATAEQDGVTVTLQAVSYSGVSEAYTQWLRGRRLDLLVEQLIKLGVDADRLQRDFIEVDGAVDGGEVRILVSR